MPVTRVELPGIGIQQIGRQRRALSRRPRILLVNTNTSIRNEGARRSSGGVAPVLPLGLEYVASAMLKAGHEVQVLDLATALTPKTREEYPRTGWYMGPVRERREAERREILANTIMRERPDAVAFSFRNLDSAFFPSDPEMEPFEHFLGDLKTMVAVAREAASPAPRIILGGSGFSIFPQAILRETGAEFGVTGAGETAFPELINGLMRNEIDPGTIVSRPFDFSQAGYTRGQILGINYAEYLARGASANIQTKRGCRMVCNYCVYPKLEGRMVHLRSPETVLDEIEQLLQLGFSSIYFADNVFNRPLSHAKAILNGILRRNLFQYGFAGWDGFISPAATDFDAEFLELLMNTKGYWIGPNGEKRWLLSVDSGSDTMLKNYGKNFTINEITRVVGMTREAGLHIDLGLLIGGDGETWGTIRETCEFLVEHSLLRDARFQFGVRLYPNTPLAQKYHGELWRDEVDLLPLTFLPFNGKPLRNIHTSIARRIEEFASNSC